MPMLPIMSQIGTKKDATRSLTTGARLMQVSPAGNTLKTHLINVTNSRLDRKNVMLLHNNASRHSNGIATKIVGSKGASASKLVVTILAAKTTFKIAYQFKAI